MTSSSCSNCKEYKLIVNQVADKYGLTVYELVVNKLNYNEYFEIHNKYSSLRDLFNKNDRPSILTPTTIIMKNDEEIASVLGNIGYDGFLDLLKYNKVV